MKLKHYSLIFTVCAGVALTACKKEGCTDPTALNYSEKAKKDDGSCTYENEPQTIVDTLACGVNDLGEAVYWKNGVEYVLTPGVEGEAMGIVATSDNKIHVAGASNGFIKYWIDGVETSILTNGLGNFCFQMRKIGDDIYIIGWDRHASFNYMATYWKNGVPVYLTDGSSHAMLYDLAIINGDVRAVGVEGGVPKYWFNGIESTLPTTSTLSSATGIVENNGVMYISGHERNPTTNKFQIVTWISGVKSLLTSELDNCYSYDAAFVGSSHLIVGTNGTTGGVVWNGTSEDVYSSTGEVYGISTFEGTTFVCGYDGTNESATIWIDGNPRTLKVRQAGNPTIPYVESVYLNKYVQ